MCSVTGVRGWFPRRSGSVLTCLALLLRVVSGYTLSVSGLRHTHGLVVGFLLVWPMRVGTLLHRRRPPTYHGRVVNTWVLVLHGLAVSDAVDWLASVADVPSISTWVASTTIDDLTLGLVLMDSLYSMGGICVGCGYVRHSSRHLASECFLRPPLRQLASIAFYWEAGMLSLLVRSHYLQPAICARLELPHWARDVHLCRFPRRVA